MDEDAISRRELDALRDYIDSAESRANLKIEALTYQVEAAFKASQRAIDKADEATEKRFEGVNEFRAALSDQATRFVTIEALRSMSDKLQATDDRNREDINNLTSRMNLREGETAGSRITTGVLVTITTVLIAAIGLIIVLANYFASH